jgi:hypothetical protein
MALSWEISIYMYLVELLYHISCLTEMCEKNDLGEIREFLLPQEAVTNIVNSQDHKILNKFPSFF